MYLNFSFEISSPLQYTNILYQIYEATEIVLKIMIQFRVKWQLLYIYLPLFCYSFFSLTKQFYVFLLQLSLTNSPTLSLSLSLNRTHLFTTKSSITFTNRRKHSLNSTLFYNKFVKYKFYYNEKRTPTKKKTTRIHWCQQFHIVASCCSKTNRWLRHDCHCMLTWY